MNRITPILSIIVPTLNEESSILNLLDSLSKQEDIHFELIVSDGGSTDQTLSLIESVKGDYPFPVRVISSEKGRAQQLNCGAEVAQSDMLLFLHADSTFDSTITTHTLKNATDMLTRESATDRRVAGRFQLCFVDTSSVNASIYFYHEVKARLNRPGTIHGDQGFMMNTAFWQEIGPFNEDLMILEDTFLADKVLAQGRWILFPDIIYTSARRFETEGISSRRALNALIMNFAHIGWPPFFEEAKRVYRDQVVADQQGELNFSEFLNSIQIRLKQETVAKRMKTWSQTGRYICHNSWQLFFMLASNSAYRKGLTPDQVKEPLVSIFLFQMFTKNPVGYLVTAIGTWCWFHYRRVEGK